MQWSFKREVARKVIHFLSLFILLFYFWVAEFFNPDTALTILVFVLIFFLFLEYIRLEVSENIPLLGRLWKYVRRDKEKRSLGGEIYFLIGAIIVLAVFDPRIAVAAILMTIFGDMAAALVGKRFGKHYISFLKEKAWEGVLAQFFVDIVMGVFVFFFLTGGSFLDIKLWIVVVVMSLTATVTETLISKIDDNLLVPLFAGFDGHITLLLLSLLL